MSWRKERPTTGEPRRRRDVVFTKADEAFFAGFKPVFPPCCAIRWSRQHQAALGPCGRPSIGFYLTGQLAPMCSRHFGRAPLRGELGRLLRWERKLGIAAVKAAATDRFVAHVIAQDSLQRVTCPECGCGRGTVCLMQWEGNEGHCAAAGDVPGHDCCSACLSPDADRTIRTV